MVVVIAMLAASALHPSGWQAGIDLRSLDSFFYPSVRVDGEFSYRFSEVRVTIPLRYTHSNTHELDFAETGLIVSVYPFDGLGFYAGVSMLRIGYAWGLEAPADPLILFSEAMIGWTFEFPYFFVEPRISVTDIFSSEKGRLDAIREAVPQYSPIRISLIVGCAF